jgi:glycosyltransferase involved in cell wall biosynthesis
VPEPATAVPDGPRRIAVVHDWLVTWGGAERVLEQVLLCVPRADVFTLVDFLPEDARAQLAAERITPSSIQRLPFAKRLYWYYLPLMTVAVEQFDLSRYDLVLSSSHAVAKGALAGPDQLHVSYVHSPMRFVWDAQPQYLEAFGWGRGVKGLAARGMFHYLRLWDARTAAGVDDLIANSRFVARRIEKTYRRPSTVIYPPVDTNRFTPADDKEDFYLTSAFMNPFKQTALVVEAFRRDPRRRLLVTGTGPEEERIRALAGPNVELLGHVSIDELSDLMGRARAFVFAAAEDFGIVMAEAQASGTPVIALRKGGAVEIVTDVQDANRRGDAPTGVLFERQAVDALLDALDRFEAAEGLITPQACRQSALRFSEARFRSEFRAHVDAAWRRWTETALVRSDDPCVGGR